MNSDLKRGILLVLGAVILFLAMGLTISGVEGLKYAFIGEAGLGGLIMLVVGLITVANSH